MCNGRSGTPNEVDECAPCGAGEASSDDIPSRRRGGDADHGASMIAPTSGSSDGGSGKIFEGSPACAVEDARGESSGGAAGDTQDFSHAQFCTTGSGSGLPASGRERAPDSSIEDGGGDSAGGIASGAEGFAGSIGGASWGGGDGAGNRLPAGPRGTVPLIDDDSLTNRAGGADRGSTHGRSTRWIRDNDCSAHRFESAPGTPSHGQGIEKEGEDKKARQASMHAGIS